MYIENGLPNVALTMGLVPALNPFSSNSWVCERVINWLVSSRRFYEEHQAVARQPRRGSRSLATRSLGSTSYDHTSDQGA